MLPTESLLFFTHDPRNSYDKKYYSEDRRRSNGVFHKSLRDCIEYDDAEEVPIDESEAIPPRRSIEARAFVFLEFGKNGT